MRTRVALGALILTLASRGARADFAVPGFELVYTAPVETTLARPALRSLVTLGSPGGTVSPAELDVAAADRDLFLSRSCVGYVVLDRRRASPALRSAAVAILKLESVHEDAQFELLLPQAPPPCRSAVPPVRPGRPLAPPVILG